ncbi:MAG: zinc-binding dehydrogenase [Deltaproteobacteria bacterium]|nr:zinc-binding dehydrogenase [Deltaproteobacteria bacterium]
MRLPERMRAVVQHGPRDLRVEELPLAAPRPGEVLVRVRATGICGSDLHFWKHATYGSGVVLGHEVAGELAAVGEGVRGLAPGALGAVHTGAPCGRCERCRAGLGSHCRDGISLGNGKGIGGLAEFVAVPAVCFIPVSGGLDPGALCFAEPLANGLRCLDHPEVRQAKSALVIGAGPIGLSCLAAARVYGVSDVWVVEGRARRREAALRLGAERVLDPAEDVRAEVARRFGPGPELVIEAVGLPETIERAQRLVRPRGTVFLMGLCLDELPMRPIRWLLNELTLRSSLGCELEEHRRAVELIGSGAIDAAPLITRRIALSEAPEAFAALAAGADEIKVVVEHGRG